MHSRFDMIIWSWSNGLCFFLANVMVWSSPASAVLKCAMYRKSAVLYSQHHRAEQSHRTMDVRWINLCLVCFCFCQNSDVVKACTSSGHVLILCPCMRRLLRHGAGGEPENVVIFSNKLKHIVFFHFRMLSQSHRSCCWKFWVPDEPSI